MNSVLILDLGLYRIKSHCHYDMPSVASQDFSIFQIEILSDELRQHYKGTHILEVWTKDGERILHMVLQDEIPRWRVFDNVLVFKTAKNSPIIYVAFLKERKITAIKHPYEHEEVDMIYFDQCLIVVQKRTLRFVQIVKEDAVTPLRYQNSGPYPDNISPNEQIPSLPILDKEFAGSTSSKDIVGLVYNYLRYEVICVLADAQNNHQIHFERLNIYRDPHNDSRLIRLETYIPALIDAKLFRKTKLDRKNTHNAINSSYGTEIKQLYYITQEGIPYLVVLRENNSLDIIRNFTDTVISETRLSIQRILPTFGEALMLLRSDNLIVYGETFDQIISDRKTTDLETYYDKQLLPPCESSQYDIHRGLMFYQDSLTVNQTLFLLRDNAIFLVDTSIRNGAEQCIPRVTKMYFPQLGYAGTRVTKLHRLR
jgi:hypothetical protein